jgi:hypothetical protein
MKLSHSQINIPSFYWCLILQASIFVVIFLSSKLGLTKSSGSHRVNPYIVFFNMLATPNFFYIKKQIDLAHGAV